MWCLLSSKVLLEDDLQGLVEDEGYSDVDEEFLAALSTSEKKQLLKRLKKMEGMEEGEEKKGHRHKEKKRKKKDKKKKKSKDKKKRKEKYRHGHSSDDSESDSGSD